ncbi:Type I restriction-modification system, specificity subunit S (EC, partial [uncultured Gammaproteobacteria bacterium]
YKAVEKAILFGSRAIDTYKEASDVDIAIKGENADWSLAMTIQDHLEEETYLPFFFDVVAYGSVESEELRRHIDGKGRVLFCRGMSEGLMENGELRVENGGGAWREVRLGGCIRTNIQSIGKDYPFDEILYLDTGSITENRIEKLQRFNIKEAPSRAKRIVENDDIIYSSVRPNQLHYGFIKDPEENLVVSTGFVVISCNREDIRPKYLFYYLSSATSTEYLHSIAEASTSAYPSLKPSDIEALDIELPPLPEQKAIADILSALDDKIDLLHRQNKTLEQMAETLFRQWFVVEAGEDWEETTLGELIKIGSGKGLKKDKFDDDGQYPILGANGKIGRTNEYLFDERLIFTGRVGTLGNVFRVENKKVWLSDNTLVIKPKKYYNHIYFLLKNAKLDQFNVGSTQPLIRQSDVKEIELSVADTETHLYFEEECDLLFDKINKNKTQIRTLQSLRDTLLPKLMSGEVRVTQ